MAQQTDIISKYTRRAQFSLVLAVSLFDADGFVSVISLFYSFRHILFDISFLSNSFFHYLTLSGYEPSLLV